MTAPAARFDIYYNIHKAIRVCMSETLTTVGRMDPHDDAERSSALLLVREMLAFCRGHLEKENAYVHPAMEARAPGSSKPRAGEHDDHLRAFDDLEAAATALERADRGSRANAAANLYRALALFVGENFVHMHAEETDNNEVLWRTHCDKELLAIEHAIVASLSPQEKMFSVRWMLPALTPAERADVLRAIRTILPRDVFATLLTMLKPRLSEANWWKLSATLDDTSLAA